MKKEFRKCTDKYVNNNLFYLNKEDVVYEYVIDNNIVGYGVYRNKKYDMIQIYIKEKYQNKGYGKELFGHIIKLDDKEKDVSVKEDNIKMVKIIRDYDGKEIGLNNGIKTFTV